MSVSADPAREDKPFSYDNIQAWFARAQITFFVCLWGLRRITVMASHISQWKSLVNTPVTSRSLATFTHPGLQ